MKKLILFELRKVFSKRLALIALIGIILFSALLSFSTFQNKYAFDQNIGEGTGKTAVEIDKEIAAKYEGILTDEKVQQMMSDFAPTSDLHGLSAIYVYQNAMQSAAFSRFSDKEGNWNGLSVSDVFGNEEIKIGYVDGCNGVQGEHNKKLNNGLPILHKVPPKRDYGRYFCIMAEKGGTSHGGLTEKLSLFFHAKKQEVNAYGR